MSKMDIDYCAFVFYHSNTYMHKLKLISFLWEKLYLQRIFNNFVNWELIYQFCIKQFIFLSMICFVAEYDKSLSETGINFFLIFFLCT